jgi:hypothetical protein
MAKIVFIDEENLLKNLNNKSRSKLSGKEIIAYMREKHLASIPPQDKDIQREILVTLIKILYEIKLRK